MMESRDHTQKLPVDVWRECFDLLTTEEYLSLYRTSRFFNGITTPLVYKRIKYVYNVDMKSHHMAQLTQQLKAVKRQVQHFVHLAEDASRSTWVRECRLVYSQHIPAKASDECRENAEKEYATYVEAFITHIKKFSNLRRVHFEFNKNMDKKIMGALSSLPHLEDVILRGVKFGAHKLQPRFNIRRLCITNGSTDRNPNKTAKTLDIFSNDFLEEMDLSSWAYSPKIFASLTVQGSSKCLRDLKFSLDPKDVGILYRFLETCPNLESIHWMAFIKKYWHAADFPATLERLPASAIPRLEFYSGPNVGAKAFIPGRPVKRVVLANEKPDSQDWVHTLHAISLSKRAITFLSIEGVDCSPDSLSTIAERFPELTNLCLGWGKDNMFTGENPSDVHSDVNSAGIALEPEGPSLQPKVFHASYLSIVHWAALGRIQLPPKLELLHLLGDYQFRLIIGAMLAGEDIDEEIDVDNNNSEQQEDAHGQLYSLAQAKYLFAMFSERYPAMATLLAGDSEHKQLSDRLVWRKEDNNLWTYVNGPSVR